jgi:protein associated with RNAse G/E
MTEPKYSISESELRKFVSYVIRNSPIFSQYRINFVGDFLKSKSEIKYLDFDVEILSAKFHEVYMIEARRQGDVRHKDNYSDLPENIKEFDRVLARYVLSLAIPEDKSEVVAEGKASLEYNDY